MWLLALLGAAAALEGVMLAQGREPDTIVVRWTSEFRCINASVLGYDASITAQRYSSFTDPSHPYRSPYLYTATLTGLAPDSSVSVSIQCSKDTPRPLTFRTLPAVGSHAPFGIALLGDLGQTEDSVETMCHVLQEPGLRIVLHAGDMSYADCDQRRWDSWFRMIEPLSSSVPYMVVPGNHEIEADHTFGTSFTAYKHRFSMPEARPTEDSTTVLPGRCAPSSWTGHYNYGNSFYSFEAGIVHFIGLNPYTASHRGSPMYSWLEADLAAVDRSLTPWVVVFMHNPWYNSNRDHQREAPTLTMKQHMEPLFHRYGVNIAVSGHVHAYERSRPVAFNTLYSAGTVYLNVGDGGNREGHAAAYLSDIEPWSVFREGRHFGHAMLHVENSTHLSYAWHRNDARWGIGDAAWIINTRIA